MYECPRCGCEISLPDPLEVGEIIECPNCGDELEVISKDPPILEVFEEEEK